MLVDDRGHPRISGFELAHIKHFKSPLYVPYDGCYSSSTLAPELMEDEIEGTMPVTAYTEESDIYAFAYLCFEVSFLKYLFFQSDV